jgi:tRNA-Thr(GGU) m(6)t(6)A37 methyltransferase TsaA
MSDDDQNSMARAAIRLIPVGIIHSPYKGSADAPRQGRDSTVTCTVEIFPEYVPAMGTMEGIPYIWILYWMDRAERDLLMARRSDWAEPRPVFTIRSPARPNPLALSIGKILGVSDRLITVSGIEALDGSPVIDIKPYIRELDCIG